MPAGEGHPKSRRFSLSEPPCPYGRCCRSGRQVCRDQGSEGYAEAGLSSPLQLLNGLLIPFSYALQLGFLIPDKTCPHLGTFPYVHKVLPVLDKNRHGGQEKYQRSTQQSGSPIIAGRKHKRHGWRYEADIASCERNQESNTEKQKKPFPAPCEDRSAKAGQSFSPLESKKNRVHMSRDTGHGSNRTGCFKCRKQCLTEFPCGKGFQNIQRSRDKKGVLPDQNKRICCACIP